MKKFKYFVIGVNSEFHIQSFHSNNLDSLKHCVDNSWSFSVVYSVFDVSIVDLTFFDPFIDLYIRVSNPIPFQQYKIYSIDCSDFWQVSAEKLISDWYSNC